MFQKSVSYIYKAPSNPTELSDDDDDEIIIMYICLSIVGALLLVGLIFLIIKLNLKRKKKMINAPVLN